MAPKKKERDPSVQTLFVLDRLMETEQHDVERWAKLKKGMDLLFACSERAEDLQQQLLAQLELMAKAVNQVMQDQALMGNQLKATGDAVSRLTRWQMKMEAGHDSFSETDDVNTFSPNPGPSLIRHVPTDNHARYDREPPPHQYLPKMSFPKFDGG